MEQRFQDAIDDPENPVLDVNTSGREVLAMLVHEESWSGPELVDGSSENVLLYIHELAEFLDGELGAVLSKEPHISVQRTAAPSVYRIKVEDRPVESMPGQADDVLQALQEAIEEGDVDPILDIYEDILDSQVRRELVNTLKDVLPNINEDRIEVTDRGWLIDGYYVVDWTASVYVITDDPDEDDYEIQMGGVGKTEKDHEFVELTPGTKPERKQVKLNGEVTIVGEREMLFLSKVEWLLNRADYHPDSPFWRFNERLRKQYLRGGQ